MQTAIMNTTHPDWDEFISHLCKMMDKVGCNHTLANANYVLDRFYPLADPGKSIDYFKSKGGFCDCEILMNVYRPVPDNIEPLLNELKY